MQQICNHHVQHKIEMNIDTVENLVHFLHSIAIGEGGRERPVMPILFSFKGPLQFQRRQYFIPLNFYSVMKIIPIDKSRCQQWNH